MNFFNRILHYYIYDMRLKKKAGGIPYHPFSYSYGCSDLFSFLKYLPDRYG